MTVTATNNPVLTLRDDPELRQKMRELDYARRAIDAAENLEAVLAGLHPNTWGWGTKAQRQGFFTARQALLQAIHNYRLSRVVEDASFDCGWDNCRKEGKCRGHDAK